MRLSITMLYLICNVGLAWLVGGCASGAVVFAPTPPPPDAAPQRYTHPSGAFSAALPATWALSERYTTALAAAAFSPPDSAYPAITFAVINTGAPLDEAAFAALLDRYQTEIRPDAADYTEQERAAMGDGSWRFSGRRVLVGETGQSLNTFIQRAGALVGVAEVVLSDDAEAMRALLNAVNSFTLGVPDGLEAADVTGLAFARPTALAVLHVATWTTPAGAFFVTGEVANYGTLAAVEVPVEVALLNADGAQVTGAVDMVLGVGVLPGGFAPFSLRFGARPPQTVDFRLRVGGGGWQPVEDAGLVGAEALAWTDDSRFDDFGRLVIEGEVSSTGAAALRDVRAVATIFDAAGRVIGAGVDEVGLGSLLPGERAPFAIVIAETGGDPANYIVSVGARRAN